MDASFHVITRQRAGLISCSLHFIYFYHLQPQDLQYIVFLTSELNNPNNAPPTTFLPADIFSTCNDPQVGHLGVLLIVG